jgi:hypothetical protein
VISLSLSFSISHAEFTVGYHHYSSFSSHPPPPGISSTYRKFKEEKNKKGERERERALRDGI